MADIDLTPTEEMAANAKRGLELRRKHGRGGTAVGVARARDISNRKTLSPETVRRMHAFFSRHEKNKAGGEDDAGYIAWMLWSGDAGQGWAKRKVEQMDKSENQRSETYKAIAERLGSAATNDRPGAKAKMGFVGTAGRAGAMAARGMQDGAAAYRAGKPAVLNRLDPKYRNWSDKDLEVYGNFWMRGWTGEQMKDMTIRDPKRGTDLPGSRFSRPGAKARFSNGDKNRRLMQVLADADRRIANQVVSNIAKHYGITTQQVFNEIFDAEAEDLMDYVTEPVRSAAYVILQKKGMMSRPGAKAKFGMTNAGYKALVDAIRVYGDSAPAAVVAQAKQMKQEPTEFTDNEVMAVIAKMKQARASRPGAKEEMAHPDDPFYVGTHRFKVGDVVKTDTIVPRYGKIVRLIRAVNGQPAYVVDNLGNDAKPKQSLGRSQWNDGLLVRASRPGAKDTNAVREGCKISAEDEACLKVMSAADEKVSDKIRTLIAEGKPQKQAIAIALDLQRRGEL